MTRFNRSFVVVLSLLASFFATACGGGSGGGAVVSAARSDLVASVAFGVAADGVDTIEIVVTVRDSNNKPIKGRRVELSASGAGNILTQPAAMTDQDGVASGSLASTVAELKTITAVDDPGQAEVQIDGSATSEFVFLIPGTFFVRTSGDDGGTGTSPARAWRSLGRALSTLEPGDTLYVGPGTYAESLTVRVSGEDDEPLLLLADSDGFRTGDVAGDVVVDAAGAEFAWRFSEADNVLLRGFTVRGAMPAASGGAIYVDGGQNSGISIVENRIYDSDRGVHVRAASDVIIEDNVITNQTGASGDGIAVSNGAEVLIAHNLVYNNSRHGLRVFGSPSDVTVEFNTFYANADDQLRGEVPGGSVVVRNNVFSEGAAGGLHFDVAGVVTESNNVVFGHTDAAFEDNAGGTLDATTSVADPLFLNPAGPDGLLGGAEDADDLFLVDAASPMIDRGDADASASLLTFGGPLSGYTSRVDGVLDGSGGDGATVNAGYHYRAEVDAFVALEPGDARLYFGREGEVQVVARRFNGSNETWQSETKLDPANRTIRWVETRLSPLGTQDELLAILTDDGATTNLFLRHWDGKQWTDADVFEPAFGGIASEDAAQRGFDLEYESTSGDALVVTAHGDASPRFRTLEDGAWSEDVAVFADGVIDTKILWVELAASPLSDEITMVCLDESARLSAAIWDGTEWITPNPIVLDTESAELRDSQAFGAAYESLSGDLLVTWGYTLLIEEARFATKAAGTTDFVIGQIDSADAVGSVVRVAADPASDQIVVAMAEGDSDDDVVGMAWTGEEFDDIAELDPTADVNLQDIEVAWVGSTGRAVLLYRDADGGNSHDWAEFGLDGWKERSDVTLAIGEPRHFRARTLPGEDILMVLVRNKAGRIFALTYDGTDWRRSNGGAPLGTQLPSDAGPAEPFDFGFRR